MQTTPYIWNYLPLALHIAGALGIAGGMVVASFFVGRHRNYRVKLDPYECGMDPVGDARGRFSVRFYMVAMLFILFDVEAVFLLPWAVIFRRLPANFLVFTLRTLWRVALRLEVVGLDALPPAGSRNIVAVGLFYVWKKGILNWSYDKGDL